MAQDLYPNHAQSIVEEGEYFTVPFPYSPPRVGTLHGRPLGSFSVQKCLILKISLGALSGSLSLALLLQCGSRLGNTMEFVAAQDFRQQPMRNSVCVLPDWAPRCSAPECGSNGCLWVILC